MKQLVWLALTLLIAMLICVPSGCGQRTETERDAAIELRLRNAEPGDIIVWDNDTISFIDYVGDGNFSYSDFYGRSSSSADFAARAPGITAVISRTSPDWTEIIRQTVDKYHPRN